MYCVCILHTLSRVKQKGEFLAGVSARFDLCGRKQLSVPGSYAPATRAFSSFLIKAVGMGLSKGNCMVPLEIV